MCPHRQRHNTHCVTRWWCVCVPQAIHVHMSAREFDRRGVYEALSLPFTIAFIVARVILMSTYIADIGVFIFHDADAIRWPMAWTWLSFVLGWSASMVWTRQLVGGYVRFRKKRSSRSL